MDANKIHFGILTGFNWDDTWGDMFSTAFTSSVSGSLQANNVTVSWSNFKVECGAFHASSKIDLWKFMVLPWITRMWRRNAGRGWSSAVNTQHFEPERGEIQQLLTERKMKQKDYYSLKREKRKTEKQEQNYLVDPIRLAHNQECLNWVTYIGIWNGEQEDKERDGNLEIAYKRSQWADIATASEVKNGFLQKQSN